MTEALWLNYLLLFPLDSNLTLLASQAAGRQVG
jgi:hypothetical protein